MNESTEKLIRELSEKLGVTVDHLWGVLIRQAPISVITDLALCLAGILLLAMAFVLIKKYCNDPEEKMHHFFAWVFLTVATLILAVSIMCSISNATTALLNPEFWALKQLQIVK